jgi:pantoate--beta-alanine ligase
MEVLHTIPEVRVTLGALRRAGHRIGFVPTMGALHEGHWSLLQQARDADTAVVASIFVNPLQFGPTEDLAAYPRPLEADLDGCARHGCAAVFVPTAKTIYPDGMCTRVAVGRLGAALCGRSRPGHFEGVATVVCKLFNIVQPDVAFFGEKDFQQLVVIRRMVLDLDLPITIVGCPTVREPDGLARSSRNAYLDADQRRRAAAISAGLRRATDLFHAGERDARRLIAAVEDTLAPAQPAGIDYVAIVDSESLEPLAVVDRPARLCVAVRFGTARLIDNVALDAGRPAQ